MNINELRQALPIPDIFAFGIWGEGVLEGLRIECVNTALIAQRCKTLELQCLLVACASQELASHIGTQLATAHKLPKTKGNS